MKEKQDNIAKGPSYLLHHNDPDFWWRVKKAAAETKMSVKDLIIHLLEEKMKKIL